ncbi:MAG: type IV toxin-antitoxin system AbiEi family antitoxin domain-containing protein [Microbacteriaceae bacterium]|nr:type IV toxin-antitoxin system AbiEi family antitoxin domain-containing protein [Microbacteriaceae bacterium]
MGALQQNTHGLVVSSDLTRLGLHESAYQRATARGELIRLRRGAYCDAIEWNELSLRDRYILRMRAVAAASAQPIVFCGYSAAAIWGMPIPDVWPTEVHIVSPCAAGGRSRHGVVRHPIADAVDSVVQRFSLTATDVAGTAVDMTLALPFAQAVGCVDWALWRRNEFRTTKTALRAELERRNPRYRKRHADAVITFGTTLSDSYGESLTRAVMHELGFPPPELQVRFSDEFGTMDVDYFWRSGRIVGEFDGKSKYLRPSYGPEIPPGEAVWQEKKRQDRLRRQVSTVVRIITADVMNPARLVSLLLDAGLPRR